MDSWIVVSNEKAADLFFLTIQWQINTDLSKSALKSEENILNLVFFNIRLKSLEWETGTFVGMVMINPCI